MPAPRRRVASLRRRGRNGGLGGSEGLGRVVLHVELDNPGAMAFYESSAFERVKVDASLRQFSTALGLNPELHALYARDVCR